MIRASRRKESRFGASLARALAQADYALVDIGARGGPTGPWTVLAPFARLYACEPDAAEARRLRESLAGTSAWRSVTVFEEAIAEISDERTLYCTAKPGWSSMLEPDPTVFARYGRTSVGRVVEERTVPTIRLATAAERYGFEDACALKLDTQGTELEILQSGDELVGRRVLAVYLETNFHPFYKGQPLFADVDAFLRERGFALADLRPTYRRRGGFAPDRYSRRTAVWAHCLYLREPATLPEDTIAPRVLARLLGLAIAYEFLDLAAELVSVEPWRTVLGDEYGSSLRDDVAKHTIDVTRGRVRGLSTEGAEELFAASSRKPA